MKAIASVRALTDLMMLVFGQMSSKVIGFIAFAYLARVLEADAYGAVEIVVGMAAIGLACVEFGIGTMGARQIAQNEAPVPKVIRSVVSARFLLCIMVLPVLSLAYIFLTDEKVPTSLIAIFAASVMFGVAKHDWLFQALERMHIAAFGVTLKMLVFFLGLLILQPGRNGVFMVGVAEFMGMVSMASYFLCAQIVTKNWHTPRLAVAEGWSLMVRSAPLGFAAMVNTLAAALPVLIIAAAVSTADAGQFGAALRVVVSIQTFSWIYYFNLFPLISKSLKQDQPYLRRLVGASETFVAWGGISGALLVTLLADPIMALIFGGEFAGAGVYLAILIWAVPLSLASGTGRWMLIAQDRQGQVFWLQLTALLCGLCITLFLVPLIGPLAAAIGFTATGVVAWFAAHRIAQDGAIQPRLAPYILPIILAGTAFVVCRYVDFPIALEAIVVMILMACGAVFGSNFISSGVLLAKSKSRQTVANAG